MYTEKELMYYVPGLANLTTGTGQCNGTFTTSTGGCTISYTVQPYASQSLPTTSNSVTVTMGATCSVVANGTCTYGGNTYESSATSGATPTNDATFVTVTCSGGVNENDRGLERLQHSILWDVGSPGRTSRPPTSRRRALRSCRTRLWS